MDDKTTPQAMTLEQAQALVAAAQAEGVGPETTKAHQVELKGRFYEAMPLDLKLLEKAQVLSLMDASGQRGARAIFACLEQSLGEGQWDALVERYADGEISVQDLMDLLKSIALAQGRD